MITNVNFGAMGWDLPALVGACAARQGGQVILVTGDGSLQFNSQELLTIGSRRMRAVIFVLNNRGYQSIRSTQSRFFNNRLVGSDERSGLANPLFRALAEAYGLEYRCLSTNDEVDAKLDSVLEAVGPVLCEVRVAYEQERVPQIMSRRLEDGTMRSGRLHDQYPFSCPQTKLRQS